MTAVASPVQLQQPSSRPGWNSVGDGVGTMAQDDVGRMFVPGPRKPAQRTNSSSSINSIGSSSSTISAASSAAPTNGNIPAGADNWATRKKPTRGLWPPGKAEPTSGLSTARPQSVSSVTSSQSAASGLTALHTPHLPSGQMTNGTTQQNGVARGAPPSEGSAFLYLLPMNGTFERKTIHVPFYPDVLRIGRQTNAKTAPTPSNGFFDSKVLSRQHAEVYAEKTGRVFIRDVKSSNGTFVNGKRLSPENKESEPHELREQDVLELGIDIVSEDQKTVVHHKVAARVENAGVYASGGDITFGDLDPSGANGFLSAQHMKRAGHPMLPGIKTGGPMQGQGQAFRDPNGLQQQPWQRMWMQPISTEHIVKRLNRELNLARLQSQDIARARESFENMLQGKIPPAEEIEKKMPEKGSQSPSKKSDMHTFSEPPAPPPSQPLPEKPETSRPVAETIIQPFLQRSDTARPTTLELGSGDHSQALFILTHELKAARDQIPNLQDRVRALEQQLRDEKSARATAEERANKLELGLRKGPADPALTGAQSDDGDGIDDTFHPGKSTDVNSFSVAELSSRLQRFQANMSDMKQQMEEYRKRAETAESQRDEFRQTLAEMVEERRARLNLRSESANSFKIARSRSSEGADGISIKPEHSANNKRLNDDEEVGVESSNGHTIRPFPQRIPLTTILDKAGLDYSSKSAFGKPLTRQQAVSLQAVLKREMQLSPNETDADGALVVGGKEVLRWNGAMDGLAYHGVPHVCALTTVIVGLVVMRWLNGWEKVQRLAP